MSRPVHFEIHAENVTRASEFYRHIFNWSFENYSEYAGMPYLGVTTGHENEPGINGAIMQRKGDTPAEGDSVNGAVLTMGSSDYDADHRRILEAGGKVALPKYALPGMAWQGYYLDTEGNVFGLHQPDSEAQ